MTSTTVISRTAAAGLRGGANHHLPPIVRALDDLRRWRRATVQPEAVANLLFEATEPKTLTAYTPRQLTELAFSIVVLLGRGSPGDAQDDSMEQWLIPVGDEIMRRGAQGFYSKDIGIASLPSITPSIDTAVDALAMSLSQQEGLLRDQLQSKQVNFLLFALTESRGAPSGTWRGRKRFLQAMLPIVAKHTNDGILSRDTAVSCLRAYARSCRKSSTTTGEQQLQAGDSFLGEAVDLTRMSQELLARCSPWILEVLSEAHTLPVTWPTNLLFVYSSSSETCYSPNTEATPVVLSKVVTLLERQVDKIPPIKAGDILSYMARLGIVSEGGKLLDFCIENAPPCGRLLRALCKLGVTPQQLDSLISRRAETEAADPQDWLLPMAIAVMTGTSGALTPAMIQLYQSFGSMATDLADDAWLGAHILASMSGGGGACNSYSTPPTTPSTAAAPVSWAAEVARLLPDSITGFTMDNGYTLPVALPREKVSIRLVQPKAHVLDSGTMELSAKYRARQVWLSRLGWTEVCIPMVRWNAMASDEEKLRALTLHGKRFGMRLECHRSDQYIVLYVMAVDASDDASTTAAPSGPFILPEAIIIRDIIVFGLTPQFMSQHRIKGSNVFVVIARKSNAEATAMAINPSTVRSTLSAAAAASSQPVRAAEAHATGGIRIGELVMPLERVREDLMECQSRIRLVLACFSSSVLQLLLPSRTISLWQTEAIDLSSASQRFSTMRDLYPVEGTTGGGRRLRLGCAIHISPPGAVIPRLTENMLLPDDTVGDSSSSGIHPHGGELACVRCLPGAEGRMMCRECRGSAALRCLSCRGIAFLPCPNCHDSSGLKLRAVAAVNSNDSSATARCSANRCLFDPAAAVASILYTVLIRCCPMCMGVGEVRCPQCLGKGDVPCTYRFLAAPSSSAARGVADDRSFWDWLFTTGLAIGSVVAVVLLALYALYYYLAYRYHLDEYIRPGWWWKSTPEAVARVRRELIPFAREKCGPAALAFIDDDKMIADCISTYGFSPDKAVLALRVWLTFRYPKPEKEPPTKWTVEQANPLDACASLSDESPFPPRSSLGAMPLSRKLFHEIRSTPLGSGRTGGASMDGVGARVKVPTGRGSPGVVSSASMDGDNVKSDVDSRSCAVGAIWLASLQFD
ncbi:hypothetical protein FOZ62_023045 [Perkinsus olseni]|uniref:Uncharacterized protein n=1 Tax=Perkinsus olseni TaxID=32597 RepID=A0A7J6P8U7_PEROL|nr:hypothetical protein FOZ62_023045 [Perkinsus olseni]